MRRALSLSLAALAVLSAPAQAAQRDETRPPPVSSPEDIRRLHNYARCIAETRPQRVRALLAMDFREAAYREAADRLYRPEPRCWPLLGEAQRSRALQVRFNQRMFAARMAEALLLSDLGDGALADRVALDPARPSIEARNEEEMMSLCTVRAAPAETAAIFATAPASAEEAVAIRAITPRIAECLVAGATGEFNRPAIRSTLALAAYRLVQHNAATAAAGN
jgi:hypothetical protein